MPMRNANPERSRGAPTANKHKGHQQSKNKASYATYRKNEKWAKNRDRKLASLIRGFRGEHRIEDNNGVLNIRRVR